MYLFVFFVIVLIYCFPLLFLCILSFEVLLQIERIEAIKKRVAVWELI
jgi:hypothetical protein